jgi:outer membrane receptor protein involved in Fe transport
MYVTRGLQNNLNIETGATGTLAGLAWDVYFNHAASRLKVLNPNNTDNAKYLAAQDAVLDNGTIKCWVTTQPAYASLYPGCVPINLFDPAGPSQEAWNYLRTPTWWVLTQTVDDLGGSIHGGLWGFGLPAGEITAALSAEARWNTYDMTNNGRGPTDYVDCTGLRFCLSSGTNPLRWVQNTVAPVSSRNSVYEFAVEANVPLLKDVPLVQSLSTDLAGRYANYDNFGGVYTWKIGGDWHVDDNIHFRSTMSFDIRAPFLNDLYQPVGLSSTGFQDLLTGVNSNTRLVTRGNPNLKPEEAHTYTAGVVLTPTFIPNFNVSVDWYMTHMTNAITSISGQGTDQQNLCIASAPAYNSPFCGLYVRPYAPGNPLYTSAANYPTEVWSSPTNAAIQQMEGWNIEANYHFAVDDIVSGWGGDIALRDLATYQPVNFSRTLTTAFPTWAFAPKFRQSTFVSYTNGNFTLSLQNQFLSSTKKATSTITSAKQNYAIASLGSNDVLDVTVSERFDFWGASNEAYLSISNIANTRAPLYTAGTAGLPGLFYPTASFHDDMGRYFTLGLRGAF